MDVFLKRTFLIGVFAIPLAALTLFSLLIVWPLFMVFDWIDGSGADASRALEEVLSPWLDFVAQVKNVKPNSNAG